MLEQHNEEMAKIAKTYESANQQWTGEKEEIQKKFIKKLSAVHSKLKVSPFTQNHFKKPFAKQQPTFRQVLYQNS